MKVIFTLLFGLGQPLSFRKRVKYTCEIPEDLINTVLSLGAKVTMQDTISLLRSGTDQEAAFNTVDAAAEVLRKKGWKIAVEVETR